jgi:Virulence factor
VARYRVLYWQDVPSLVKAFEDDGSHVSRELPAWFQQEIDRRAMAQGLSGSDAYLEQWRWGGYEERPGAAADVLDAVVEELSQTPPHRTRPAGTPGARPGPGPVTRASPAMRRVAHEHAVRRLHEPPASTDGPPPNRGQTRARPLYESVTRSSRKCPG